MIRRPDFFRTQLENKQGGFEQDVYDLFAGLKSAHLASHTFSYSADLWEDFFNTPSDYYVVRDEISLIEQNMMAIRRTCQGSQNIIDLGPGSEGAVQKKILPVLKAMAFHLRKYIAIDVSEDYLDSAADVVSAAFPSINIETIHDNFFNPRTLAINERSIALLMGLTLSNMPGIVDKNSGIAFLKEEVRIFRALLPKGAFFLCSFDTCQNEEKLLKAYNQPKHAKFIESIAVRMKQELRLDDGFDPRAWFYNPKWDSKNHMFKHIITSRKEMDFSIGDRHFHLPEGHDILSYVSVKFPEKLYMDIFADAGFELATDLFKGPDGDIVLVMLRAV